MRITIISTILLFRALSLFADEGMWLPLLLGKNEAEMRSMGMRLSAEDIYSVNHACIKDAIVHFGGGCTAGIVSDKGLILTNHHCGFGQIQSHSTLERDYLKNGFWAMRIEEELSCPGLTVELLVRMEDVTKRVLEGVRAGDRESGRDSIIEANIKKITDEAKKGTHYGARVRAFYYGNEYYLFVYETFRDIRFVGAPPTNIGNFGGDTDNWVWPRHTCDFSIFRIYVGKDGKPAEYSADNIPYTPKYYLPVSVKGYKEGDFTMVYGYPGRTQEYLPSWGVELAAEIENPIRIELRTKRLEVIKEYMHSDRKIGIQYASKASGIANGWKKWMGESRGIRRLGVITTKREQELEFQTWAYSDPLRKARYGNLLKEFGRTYELMRPLDVASVYYAEAGMGVELLRFAVRFAGLVNLSRDRRSPPEEISKAVKQLTDGLASFYKDYQPAIDRELMPVLLEEYNNNISEEYRPAAFRKVMEDYGGDFRKYSDAILRSSFLASEQKVREFLRDYKPSRHHRLMRDPAFRLAMSCVDAVRIVNPQLDIFRDKLDSLQRLYMRGLMEMSPGKRFYPDANSTMRVAYGTISDYKPADAVGYNYFTTIGGLLQKEDSAIYDYEVNPRLRELALAGDFGRYADKSGTLNTCFIANNHTSGGNSGSPVLDAAGRLIGLNFDRCWEGTMSDLRYDPDQCRNITLDIRYCLWVIEKTGGAKNLIEEMKIVD